MSEKKKKLPDIEVRALRGKEARTFERLLCQGLIVANNSPNALKKILKLTECVLMVEDSIKIDRDLVDLIYQIGTGFRYAQKQRFYRIEYWNLPWPFEATLENYEKYILPWKGNNTLFFFPVLMWGYPSQIEKASEQAMKTHRELPEWARFFTITMEGRPYLSPSSFDQLLSEFVRWALPKVQSWYIELTKLVDETVFDSMLKTMYGGEKKPEEEE